VDFIRGWLCARSPRRSISGGLACQRASPPSLASVRNRASSHPRPGHRGRPSSRRATRVPISATVSAPRARSTAGGEPLPGPMCGLEEPVTGPEPWIIEEGVAGQVLDVPGLGIEPDEAGLDEQLHDAHEVRASTPGIHLPDPSPEHASLLGLEAPQRVIDACGLRVDPADPGRGPGRPPHLAVHRLGSEPHPDLVPARERQHIGEGSQRRRQ
jgi:hypothetical protein